MSRSDTDRQTEIDAVNHVEKIWSGVWRSQQDLGADTFFRHPLFLSGYRAMVRHLAGWDGKVLEAGGGPGRYGIKLASDNPNCRVDVVDISADSIDLGKRLARERGVSNVQFTIADIMSLPFEDNSYDCVISDAVIQVFENYTDAVSEMARVLKPGGVMIIAACNFWNPHTIYKWVLSAAGLGYQYGFEKSFTHRELADAISASGLRVVAADGFAPGYGAARLRFFPFRLLGSVIDLLAFVGDKIAGGRFSKTFGFEILVVATKAASERRGGLLSSGTWPDSH
jgi:SAM-dependent methyltransferase